MEFLSKEPRESGVAVDAEIAQVEGCELLCLPYLLLVEIYPSLRALYEFFFKFLEYFHFGESGITG